MTDDVHYNVTVTNFHVKQWDTECGEALRAGVFRCVGVLVLNVLRRLSVSLRGVATTVFFVVD